MRCGFIGLGNLGRHLAGSLVRAGVSRGLGAVGAVRQMFNMAADCEFL
jgi:3-hydroxyisobutyrate dehydrogenase-like beta-hydroxyacid dehydrogenase